MLLSHFLNFHITGTSTNLTDFGQIPQTVIFPSTSPEEDVVVETDITMPVTPQYASEKHEPDSGNELSSSSLDSHDSATTSTDQPMEKCNHEADTCLPSNEENPPRPCTLELPQSLNKQDEENITTLRDSTQGIVNENDLQCCPDPPKYSDERRALEMDLVKCIDEFRRIRIPVVFPNKKRNWQHELLRKYQL
ncbi:BTB/POZ domain-containing protein KCTD8-like [Spea bombifrons]|uniref:BTB/POZ domain-containing protein KCTD8-like n=1 Tax=Spea bombifrons TaxID=233779 RepID=UPI00234A9C26|nr:BTB/POZ domain-containing protein KCTD8-like [Spea bombifrons]